MNCIAKLLERKSPTPGTRPSMAWSRATPRHDLMPAFIDSVSQALPEARTNNAPTVETPTARPRIWASVLWGSQLLAAFGVFITGGLAALGARKRALAKGSAMKNPKAMASYIHGRRVGIDMITMPFELETHYAKPDALYAEGVAGGPGGWVVPASEEDEETEMVWSSCYAEPGQADRNIALRNVPGLKDVEDRMNIVSNRVIDIDPHSNTTIRLESDLEARALAILKTLKGVVAVRAQYLVMIEVEGVLVPYWFDLCVDYDDDCRELIAVRNAENAAEQEALVELFRNQEMPEHAHFAYVWTEKELSKPAVYRAEEIVRARRVNNEANNRMVLQKLIDAGGRARVGHLLSGIPGVTFASAWDAMWSLIDRGLVIHDVRRPLETNLEHHSWLRATKEGFDAYA